MSSAEEVKDGGFSFEMKSRWILTYPVGMGQGQLILTGSQAAPLGSAQNSTTFLKQTSKTWILCSLSIKVKDTTFQRMWEDTAGQSAFRVRFVRRTFPVSPQVMVPQSCFFRNNHPSLLSWGRKWNTPCLASFSSGPLRFRVPGFSLTSALRMAL